MFCLRSPLRQLPDPRLLNSSNVVFLLPMLPLYQARRACLALCPSQLGGNEKAASISTNLLCCGTQEKRCFDRSHHTTDDFRSYWARHCSETAASCFYYLSRGFAKRVEVAPSCASCSRRRSAFKTSSVCTFRVLVSLLRSFLLGGFAKSLQRRGSRSERRGVEI